MSPRRTGDQLPEQRLTAATIHKKLEGLKAENPDQKKQTALTTLVLQQIMVSSPKTWFELIKTHPQYAIIYTPGIGEIIGAARNWGLAKAQQLWSTIESHAPWKRPVAFDFRTTAQKLNSQQGIDSDGSIEGEVKQQVRQRITAQVVAVYEARRGQNDRHWNELSLAEQQAVYAQTLIVGTDQTRVLGLGYVGGNTQTEGGSWITFGKNDCYFAATRGGIEYTVGFGLDLGAPGEISQNTRDQMWKYVLEVVDEMKIGVFQFEDLKEPFGILQWAAENLKNTLVFNDDKQGTGAITEAAVINTILERAGIRQRPETIEELIANRQFRQELIASRFVFYGAGGASFGSLDPIAEMLRRAYRAEDEAFKCMDDSALNRIIRNNNFVIVDSQGVVHNARTYNDQDAGEVLKAAWALDFTAARQINDLKKQLPPQAMAIYGPDGVVETQLGTKLDFLAASQYAASQLNSHEKGTLFAIGYCGSAGQGTFLPGVFAHLTQATGLDKTRIAVASGTNPTAVTEAMPLRSKTPQQVVADLKPHVGFFYSGSPLPDTPQLNNKTVFEGLGWALLTAREHIPVELQQQAIGVINQHMENLVVAAGWGAVRAAKTGQILPGDREDYQAALVVGETVLQEIQTLLNQANINVPLPTRDYLDQQSQQHRKKWKQKSLTLADFDSIIDTARGQLAVLN